MKKDTRAFASQLLICVLVTMTVGGSIGLGTVWLRYQNSLIAKGNSALAARIAELDRRNDEIKTLIQAEHRPELLRRRNVAQSHGLVPKSEVQIVPVTHNVIERMAERANRSLFIETRAPAVPVVQVKLAAR